MATVNRDSEQVVMQWHDKIVPDGSYDDGHRHMCRYGIEQVRAGRYDAIRFDTFSDVETEPIKAIMAELAPDVAYIIKPLFGSSVQVPVTTSLED